MNFSLPTRFEQLSGSNANEIKHGHSPVAIVTLDPSLDPRPLLIVSPSAFGLELAYKLGVAKTTLMDVTRYFYILLYYYCIYVCEEHYYDLSALAIGPVSMRRIIYKFLNVCLFYNTAFAASGKVRYPYTGLTTPVGCLLLLHLTVQSRSTIVV